MSATRASAAVVRAQPPSLRFGRHEFVRRHVLREPLRVSTAFVSSPRAPTLQRPAAAVAAAGHLEAVLHLRPSPLLGVRTVAARYPRRVSHAHRDANPSLILWMNDDSRSGGALCPVCRQRNQFVTWRVLYLPDGAAALYTSLSRALPPRRAHAVALAPCNTSPCFAPAAADAAADAAPAAAAPDAKVPSKCARAVNVRAAADAPSRASRSRAAPVGACAMAPNKLPHVGHVISTAYVTASLRTFDTSVATPDGQHIRLRIPGTKTRLSCPMQLLLWSDRRSQGPLVAQRVQEVAWYAKQIADPSLQLEQWLPTPLVSVSTMRPSSWRELNASDGRSVSVLAGWVPTAQRWILFDIGDLQGLARCVSQVASKLVLIARKNPELSGRCLVVHTVPQGVHLSVELREVRQQPKEWFRKEQVGVWYAKLGYRLLRACHRAGTTDGLVDMSSCAACRFARRPGWRRLKDGSLFRSRVVMHVPGPIKNLKPRMLS